MAAVSVVPSILDYVGDDVIRSELLPRAKLVHSANSGDVKIVLSLLACIAKVLFLSQCVSSESSLSMLFYSKGNPGCARALVLSLAKIQEIFKK